MGISRILSPFFTELYRDIHGSFPDFSRMSDVVSHVLNVTKTIFIVKITNVLGKCRENIDLELISSYFSTDKTYKTYNKLNSGNPRHPRKIRVLSRVPNKKPSSLAYIAHPST